MLETISQFIKDWGAMTPSRKLSTLLMVLLFCAFMGMSYLYRQSERKNEARDLIRNAELEQCYSEKQVYLMRIGELEAEFRRYLISEKKFKLQLKDSLNHE